MLPATALVSIQVETKEEENEQPRIQHLPDAGF
jgi:hypothetical protein